MVNPWLGIVGVLVVMLALQGGLHFWRAAHPTHAELARKLIHISLGLITLSFPWLFDSVWPVVVVCLAIIAWLVGLRSSTTLRSHLGGAIHSVARRSLGEIYFPLSVVLLFVLSQGDPLLYCVPILILTLADTAAALVGAQYGSLKYTTPEGSRKSAEGSVAFFAVAFFSVHVPLLLVTQTGRAESLLIALILGLLVTLFEAIAWLGLDNVFIPLGGFFLLKELLTLSVAELSLQLAILLVVAAIALVRRAQTTFDDSALLGAVLAGYVIWVLGGWQWIVIPLILFLTGRPLPSAAQRGQPHFHNIQALLSVACPGLVWLLLAKTVHQPDLIYPFTLTFAVHLALFEVGKLKPPFSQRSAALLGTLYGAKSWVMLFVPFVLIEGLSVPTAMRALVAIPVVVLAAIGFLITQPHRETLPTDTARWVRQAAWSSVGSAVGLVPLVLF